MLEYRLYLIDAAGNRKPIDLICANDEAAIAEAMRRVDGHAMELWHRARIVTLAVAPGRGPSARTPRNPRGPAPRDLQPET